MPTHEEEKPFRCVMIQTQEPGEPGSFATIIWWECDFDIMAEDLRLEDPEHALDTPLPGPGIWIWTGFMVGPEFKGRGDYRTLTDPEWAMVRKGQAPWDKAKDTQAIEIRDRVIQEHPDIADEMRHGQGFFLEVLEGKLYLRWVEFKRLQVGTVEPLN